MSKYKFSFVLVVSKIYYLDNSLGSYPFLRRNLSIQELENNLKYFVCDAFAEELISKVKDLINSVDQNTDYYRGKTESYRQVIDTADNLYINISMFVD